VAPQRKSGSSSMKTGDLIKFINLTPYGKRAYLGVVLEYHGTWAKMLWCSDVHEQIQDSIIVPKQWKVIQ
jgi:hypothetical protein